MKKVLILFLFSLFLSPAAWAHFHYELPLNTTLVTNPNKELTGLNIVWIYDDELTELMFNDQKNVKKMGEKLMADLNTLGYFTFLKLNGKVLNTLKVTDYKLEEVKSADYRNLKLSFHLPLKKPVLLTGEKILEFRHEDANASAILYYDKSEHLNIGKALQESCKVDIVEKKDFEEGEAPQSVKILCK